MTEERLTEILRDPQPGDILDLVTEIRRLNLELEALRAEFESLVPSVSRPLPINDPSFLPPPG